MFQLRIILFMVSIFVVTLEGRHERCNLPMEQGLCLAYVPSFGYNTDTERCEKFIYGGCAGNANRFATLRKCQRACVD